MKKQIAVLPGDGIGEEVMTQALRVLGAIAEYFDHQFTAPKALVGGAAYDKYKSHLPEETLSLCKSSDAILFGSVGGPCCRTTSRQMEKLRNQFHTGIA